MQDKFLSIADGLHSTADSAKWCLGNSIRAKVVYIKNLVSAVLGRYASLRRREGVKSFDVDVSRCEDLSAQRPEILSNAASLDIILQDSDFSIS